MKIYTTISNKDTTIALEKSLDPSIPEPIYRTYFFSNDKYLLQIKRSSAERIKNMEQSNFDCSIIVGTGAFLSFLEILPRLVIFTDNDLVLLSWLYLEITIIRQEPTLKGFIDKLYLKDNPDGLDRLPKKLLEIEMDSLGSEHFMYSQMTYEKARRELKNHIFNFVVLNYSSEADILLLGRLLTSKNLRISFANFTNLHTFLSFIKRKNGEPHDISKELNLLSNIPFKKDALFIARPAEEYNFNISPIVGINNYSKIMTEISDNEALSAIASENSN